MKQVNTVEVKLCLSGSSSTPLHACCQDFELGDREPSQLRLERSAQSLFLQPALEHLEEANAWFLEQGLALMFLSTVLQSLLKEVKAHSPGWGLLEHSSYY